MSRTRFALAPAALILAVSTLTSASLACAQGDSPDPALQRLNDSPRHHEWVQVKHGERTVHAFVVFPEVEKKAPAVLVIHENRGLSDWVRGVADQLAEHGYIAIAPDLLSGAGPDGGKTSDFPDTNAARDAIYELEQAQVTADLDAVADYAKSLPASNGTLTVAGFCWGGRQSFEFATHRSDLAAAFVFYGTPPRDEKALRAIEAPVYGFYGGADNRVTSTVKNTQQRMQTAGKTYEPEVYEGAGHGFLRAGEAPDAGEANRKAHDAGWERWLKLLGGLGG
jgi:carboxymethylenebutenolidase